MGYLTKAQIAAIIQRNEELRAAVKAAREQLAAAFESQPPAQPTTGK